MDMLPLKASHHQTIKPPLVPTEADARLTLPSQTASNYTLLHTRLFLHLIHLRQETAAQED